MTGPETLRVALSITHEVPNNYRLLDCLAYVLTVAERGPQDPEWHDGENDVWRGIFAEVASNYHKRWQE